MVYPISKLIFWPIFRIFIKEIDGKKNIPKNGPYIITSNHESYLDPWLIDSTFLPIINRKIHFLANKGRFWDIFGDKISRQWLGCVPLDEGKEKALNELSQYLKNGEIVALFIEGKRSEDGNLLKGKTGVVRLAIESRVPILPLGIRGTFNIAPGNKLIPKLRRADLIIGDLIYLDQYYGKKVEYNTLQYLTTDLMKVISKLSGKTYNH